MFPTKLVHKISGVTENQLKYWVKKDLVNPQIKGNKNFYSFRDIIKIRLIVTLKKGGLSLQKITKGIRNLSKVLPESDSSLSHLFIYTDGIEMLVIEKGTYFSATTLQKYFRFDTEKLNTEIIQLNGIDVDLNGTLKKVAI